MVLIALFSFVSMRKLLLRDRCVKRLRFDIRQRGYSFMHLSRWPSHYGTETNMARKEMPVFCSSVSIQGLTLSLCFDRNGVPVRKVEHQLESQITIGLLRQQKLNWMTVKERHKKRGTTN